MKKVIFAAFMGMLLLLSTVSTNILADGAIGLQLGRITFGLGRSINGPIVGIGPSPSNNLPIAFPIVPGGCCY